MDEETIFKTAELLERRKERRIRLASAQKYRTLYEEQAVDYLHDINVIQRELRLLGYTGQ